MAIGGRLAIIGAGSVGTSLAFAALIRRSAREVTLYDINAKKAEAEVLDLSHGTQFTGASQMVGGSDIGVVANASVVVITAGAKQRPGQTRLELAGTNVAILRELMPQLVELAPDATFVLVTNPCDVLTVAAQQISDLPPGRVLSSGTVLDSARLRWLIAQRCRVSQQSVHALVIGEHGDTEFPLWSHATIGQTPLPEWVDEQGTQVFTGAVREEIADDVVHAAYRVIDGKGATNYAIGLSGARIVEAILRDECVVLPVSTVLDGYRGIQGVALSVPSIVGAGGVHRTLDMPMTDDEVAQLEASAEALRSALGTLGLH
jgi:L-lactate dehydrogenase